MIYDMAQLEDAQFVHMQYALACIVISTQLDNTSLKAIAILIQLCHVLHMFYDPTGWTLYTT